MRNRGKYTGLQGRVRKVELSDRIGTDEATSSDYLDEDLAKANIAVPNFYDADPTIHSDDEIAERANEQLRRVAPEHYDWGTNKPGQS